MIWTLLPRKEQSDGRLTPGSAINPSPMFHLPIWPIFPFNVSTPALGIARGALNAFIEYTTGRPERVSVVQRQRRIAESAAEIDAALAVMWANAAVLSHSLRTGEMPSREFLSRSVRDTSFAVKLCVQAVDRLATGLGAHGMLEDTPVQRALRDVHAVANHAADNFDNAAIVYARHALGLPPLPDRGL